MSKSDMFAMKNSGLEAFLFAEVGTELNGSRLTMLSVLARLGQDPWAVAARWVALPRTAVIDQLVQCLSTMPLCPESRDQARTTAVRAVQLLPNQIHGQQSEQETEYLTPDPMPKWVPAVLLAGLVFGAALSLARLPPPPDAPASRTVLAQQPFPHD